MGVGEVYPIPFNALDIGADTSSVPKSSSGKDLALKVLGCCFLGVLDRSLAGWRGDIDTFVVEAGIAGVPLAIGSSGAEAIETISAEPRGLRF